MTCRQAPHGEQGTPWPLTTATARISSSGPSAATAENIAVRSAQLVIPYEEFSTLHPTKTLPFEVRIAAPTLKFENGTYAFFITARAERRRRSRIAAETFVFRIGKLILQRESRSQL